MIFENITTNDMTYSPAVCPSPYLRRHRSSAIFSNLNFVNSGTVNILPNCTVDVVIISTYRDQKVWCVLCRWRFRSCQGIVQDETASAVPTPRDPCARCAGSATTTMKTLSFSSVIYHHFIRQKHMYIMTRIRTNSWQDINRFRALPVNTVALTKPIRGGKTTKTTRRISE